MNEEAPSWSEQCRQGLLREMERVRLALEHHDTGREDPCGHHAAQLPDTALALVQRQFGLSDFERDLLVLCAGVETDGTLAALCATAQKDARCTSPTFGLALAALADPHWSALSPVAPLRFWRLVEVGAGPILTAAPLRIDERVLHYLLGVSYLDERLHPLWEMVRQEGDLAPSHLPLVRSLVALWEKESTSPDLTSHLVQITGSDPGSVRNVASVAAAEMGRFLFCLRAEDIPKLVGERHSLAQLWRRETLLNPVALFLEITRENELSRSQLGWVETLGGCVVLGSREPVTLPRQVPLRLELPAVPPTEQHQLWRRALGSAAHGFNGELDQLVSAFPLQPSGIWRVAEESRRLTDELPFAQRLWQICRRHSRATLGDLAQRIEPASGWEDLVLPAEQKTLLREMTLHLKHRLHVYYKWGFASRSSRGLGLSALFSGPSGTGKTTAAEVLAREVGQDLYRIDLSAVVSKYIGETEKNLRRVFDAAELSGAILLFDEADALFGRRSEVRDSHDRYANIEVSYLLQRMEEYPGLALLTTNFKSALDPAFLRRLRFVIEFPFPDAALRQELWRTIFPSQTPVRDLDYPKLARLNIAGGNIRNIAMGAAFLAAGDQAPVQMKHLLAAARTEYRKMEKPLTEAESSGWDPA